MKGYKIIILLFLSAVFWLNSCATRMYYTSLDVLRPAEVTFPMNVNKVVIVNNAVAQPQNVGHTSSSDYDRQRSYEIIPFDSTAIFATAGLKDGLNRKSFFSRIELSLINQNPAGNYNIINKLSDTRVKTLRKVYNADAVIALDRILINDHVAELYGDGVFYNELNAKVKTDWSIYYPDRKTVHLQFVDSFLWQSDNYNRTKAQSRLPNRYDALVDACILSGSNTAERMIPRWEKEDRYFFNPKNKIMLQAMDSVPTRNWRAAIALWKTAAENSKQTKIKYQAYNNIAIGYEIMGDMDKAIEYAQKALDAFSPLTHTSEDGYVLTTYYQNLIKRKKEMELLKRQLGN